MFKSNGGFTLVELIVVIAILGLLAGIGIPAYSGMMDKAKGKIDTYQATINKESEDVQAIYDAYIGNAAADEEEEEEENETPVDLAG